MMVHGEAGLGEVYRYLELIFEDSKVRLWDATLLLLWTAILLIRKLLDLVKVWMHPNSVGTGDTVTTGEQPTPRTSPNRSDSFSAAIEAHDWKIPEHPVLVPGKKIAIWAPHHGRFVSADKAGASPLIANRFKAFAWEHFYVVDAGNGAVALRAYANGLYVCAENSGNSPLIANRSSVGPWESFVELDAGAGGIALLAVANNKIVSSASNCPGIDHLIAKYSHIREWERFTIDHL